MRHLRLERKSIVITLFFFLLTFLVQAEKKEFTSLFSPQDSICVANLFHCIGKPASTTNFTAQLSDCCATPPIMVNWWDAPSGGNLLATGLTFNPFTSGYIDSLSTTCATVYAECVCPAGGTSTRSAAHIEVVDCVKDCNDGCNYFLVLEDSANNGWEGASIDVSLNEDTPVNYKLPSGNCNAGYEVISFVVQSGHTIDVEYWETTNAEEHAWVILDWNQDTVLASGYDANGQNTVAPTVAISNSERVKTACPSCCTEELVDVLIRITLGDNPEEQSWELAEGYVNDSIQGTQIIGINGILYQGLDPGAHVEYTVTLDKCQAYTFSSFDAMNDGWNGGSWEVITSDINYGTEITSLADPAYGNSLLLSGPSNLAFTDIDRVSFNAPCQNCYPENSSVDVFGGTACQWSGVLPVNEPYVCYPNCNHALPDGCLTENLIVLADGNPALASTIATGPFSYTNGVGQVDLSVLGINLPVGCHKLIHEVIYCDGIISKCTTDLNIVQETNPSMVCNDLLHISLAEPDDLDQNGTNFLNDDFGECVIEIRPDMLLEMPNVCDGEYIVEILDVNGNPLIVYGSNGLPLDQNGIPIPTGNQSIEAAHDLISYAQIGQTLNYTVSHKYSGNVCWGQIIVEDKLAPTIVCNDYNLNCTHPHALDEFYTHTEQYVAPTEMPIQIVGGIIGQVSNTWIPINMECVSMSEVIKDIQVQVDLIHTDVTHLDILLHLPDAMIDAGLSSPIQLEEVGGVGTSNLYIPNPSGDASGLLALLGTACENTTSTQPEDFVTENSGNFQPSNLGNTWYIQVIDNNQGDGITPVGTGEITAASITLTCGFPTPVFAYDCALDTMILLDEMIVETHCDQSEWNGAVIERVWQASDDFGHTSTCTQTVGLQAPSFDRVQWPDNVTLACDATADPLTEAGIPAFGCFPITDDYHGLCDMTYTYDDQTFSTCGNSSKILRTWTIINWCTGVSKDYVQTIHLSDQVGPTIDVANILANTNTYTCDATVDFNQAVTDDCGEVISLTVSYLIGGNPYLGNEQYAIVDILNGEQITGLGLGDTELTITAKDECLNLTEETITITVEDNSAPIAVCKDQLHISLGDDGKGQISATQANAGSFDNCSEVTLAIRRVGGCLGTSDWGETAELACCDLDETIAIELLVTDAAGNSNKCWKQLVVEDAIDPTISCPADITINCDDEGLHAMEFGMPSPSDNCFTEMLDYQENSTVDQCNAGLITRTWTYDDGSDKSGTATCTQRITVNHISDFIVQFPSDVTIGECPSGDLGMTGEPTISDDDCELIAISHQDQVFEIVEDACFKIERTWTVINWCVYEQGNPNNTNLGTPQPLPRTYQDDDGYFKWVQTIKVTDMVPPQIECAFGPVPVDDLDNECDAFVELTLKAIDSCSPDSLLNISYFIDIAPQDGIYDIVEINGGNDASNFFEYGAHFILWVVEDGCGNESECGYEFVLADGKRPTPVCTNGLTVEMPATGCVDIWASDFLEYAFDNCSPDDFVESSVKVRILGDTNAPQDVVTFCCENLGPQGVEVWVTDEAGNSDNCTTYIVVQDNMFVCGTSRAMIAGDIKTEEGIEIQDAMVYLEGAVSNALPSDLDGHYAFPDLGMNADYSIAPQKDGDDTNGVTTYDLVLMSQHILGIEPFTSPYQRIAADVNRDGFITTFDIVQTRQLILFILNEFPDNTSWRFIDASYVFPNPQNPWEEAFPEKIDLTNLTVDEMHTDFIGVKIGDVNGSVNPNTATASSERQENRIPFYLQNEAFSAETDVVLPVQAKDFKEINGFQASLQFDIEVLEWNKCQAVAITLQEGQIGTTLLEEGILNLSWHTPNSISVSDEIVLFELHFNTKKEGNWQETIALSDRYLSNEIYQSSEVNTLDLLFQVEENLSTTSEFVLYQNQPNPFSNETLIGFQLTKDEQVELTIYDTNGKVLYQQQQFYTKGYHQETIDALSLGSSGILFYQLTTPTLSATKKMLVVD